MSIKALYLNTSLKTGDETSNTETMMQKSMDILENKGVETELMRIADYNIIRHECRFMHRVRELLIMDNPNIITKCLVQ